MISPSEYIQLKAFARQDGFFLGCLWIFTLGCFIGSMSDSPLQIGFIAGVITTPIMMYRLLKHYRDRIIGGNISFKRAFCFVALMVVYAAIILAAATFIYFYFFDDGAFMSHMQQQMAIPQIRNSFTNAGMDVKMLDEQLGLLSQSRPVDMAFSLFCNSTFTGFIAAAIIAIIGKKTQPKTSEGLR